MGMKDNRRQEPEVEDAFDIWVGLLTDLVIEPTKHLLGIPRRLCLREDLLLDELSKAAGHFVGNRRMGIREC
jgi:hypothetical protein